MKKRMFITGSGGMVGYYVESIFDDFKLFLTDIEGDYERLDVTDYKGTQKLISQVKPDVVLHLAATTDVDKCEEDNGWAYKCNRDGTKNVAMACKDCNALMVYISSGSVFSGRLNRPAREADIPDPVNIYGMSKLAGEIEVGSILKRFYIIRTGWMMGGGSSKDKKFIGKIMKRILSGEKNLRIINDRFGSPIYAKDLLMGIKRLLFMDNSGIYHMVNSRSHRCSRYDIALAIKAILKKEDLKIVPVSFGEFSLFAPRSYSEELENFRLKQENLNFMRSWKDALGEYLTEDWDL